MEVEADEALKKEPSPKWPTGEEERGADPMEEEGGTSFKEILLNRRKNDEGVEVILENLIWKRKTFW